jgi:hypothetical protein|tara:strand:- start:229 stop:513 length:285 start_codon:yes stop_codon:yes gene_type:complete
MRLKKVILLMWKEIIKQGRFDVLRNWLKEAKQRYGTGYDTIGMHESEGEAYRQFDELYNSDKQYLNEMVRQVFGSADVGSDLKGQRGHYYIGLR